MKGRAPVLALVEVAVGEGKPDSPRVGLGELLGGRPLWFGAAALALAAAFALADDAILAIVLAVLVLVVAEVGLLVQRRAARAGRPQWLHGLEQHALAFTALVLAAVLVGGVAELVPLVLVKRAVPATGAAQLPYTALELQGRDLYQREGCAVCHSQQVRPMLADAERSGAPSRAEEFRFDHPALWGSKRTGPDLHREGGRRTSRWLSSHLEDPRRESPASNMPSYPWLAEGTIDPSLAPKRLALMRRLGVPYSDGEIDGAEADQRRQAEAVVADLARAQVAARWDSEVVALIAYLQRLGRDHGVTRP